MELAESRVVLGLQSRLAQKLGTLWSVLYTSPVTTSFPGLFPFKLGGAGKDPGIGWSRDPS